MKNKYDELYLSVWLILIISTSAITFFIGSFIEATFNISLWDRNLRMFLGFGWGFLQIAIPFVLVSIMMDKLDSEKNENF